MRKRARGWPHVLKGRRRERKGAEECCPQLPSRFPSDPRPRSRLSCRPPRHCLLLPDALSPFPQVLPGRVLRVMYEDLVGNQEKVTRSAASPGCPA